MGITLTLHEVRKYHLHFFGYEMAADMTYAVAARNVVKEAGYEAIKKMQKEERMKLEEGGD